MLYPAGLARADEKPLSQPQPVLTLAGPNECMIERKELYNRSFMFVQSLVAFRTILEMRHTLN